MSATPAPGDASCLPFGEDSMARRVHGEGVLLLGGGRALLMQIAHPMVARGVAEHSRFRSGRGRRLLRTIRPMLTIVFGTREQALEAAAGVNRIHDGVAGAGYAAGDPELLLWVLATLIDTSVLMYERCVRPLTPEEAAAYYEDACRIGALLGLARREMPADLAGLREYVAGMVERLQVTGEAREIAAALFAANPLTWPALGPARAMTAALLPPSLRSQFGLAWGSRRERALGLASGASRALLPRLPAALRAPPWFLMP